MSLQWSQWFGDSDGGGGGAAPGIAPGKKTLTQSMPPSSGAGAGLVTSGSAAPRQAGASSGSSGDDPFGLHLVGAAPPAVDPVQLALIRADARIIATFLQEIDVDLTLKIDRASASFVLAKFMQWSSLGLLDELVAAVRGQKVSGPLANLLGTTSAWTYLVAVLDSGDRIRLYDVLADGNIDARNTGRFTEELVEFWDVQMKQDAGTVKAAYHDLVKSERGPVGDAGLRVRIIGVVAEYKALDERYRMKGTLLSKFLLKLDVTVTTTPGGLFSAPQQSRMLDDIKRRMGPSLGTFMAIIDASNLALLKQDAPELLTLGDSIAQDAIETFTTVGDVFAFLLTATEEVAKDCIRYLARSPSKQALLLDLIATHFHDLTTMCAYGLSFLAAKHIVAILQKIDVERLWQFYLALVTCTAGVLFLPQLFAAYWLLPEKTRARVFSGIGRTAFLPILREAKEYLVPLVRDLIDQNLPVGQGVYFERGLTASVRVAAAGGDSSFSVIRTASDRFQYDERFTVRGGVGVGGGIGKTEGKKADDSKDGTSQLFWGHELSGNLGAMVSLTTQNRYDFPIFDDDAFIGFLAAFVDIEGGVALAACVFDELSQVDPLPYLESSKLEPKLSGEAKGAAATGLREGKGGADGTHTWEGGEKPDEMGSSKWAMFGTQAGVTIGKLLEIGGSLEMKKQDGGHEVSVQIGARSASTAVVKLPGLGLLSSLVPKGSDTGAAVKVSCMIVGLAEHAAEMKGDWRLSLIGTTGDMGTGDAASETEVTVTPGAPGASLDNVDGFIAALGAATFKRRIGIASGIGGKMLSAIDNQKNLTAQLKAKYTNVGIKLKGYVDVEVELTAARTREVARIFQRLLSAAAAEASSEGALAAVRDAVVTFVTTGKLPDAVENAADALGEILAECLKKVRYHVEVGGAVAAGKTYGGNGSEGGVGGHGYAGAGWIWDDDVTDEIEALEPGELVDVVARKLTDAGEMVTEWFV